MTLQRSVRRIGAVLTDAMDQATYRGYRAGFEAARDQAAQLAREAGEPALARRIARLAPLPDRSRESEGQG